MQKEQRETQPDNASATHDASGTPLDYDADSSTENAPPARRKVDRRVVRTRRAIEDAFERLVMTTDYDKITVSAIAKEADINRKTFYLHYSSVDDLLEQMTRQQAEESIAALQKTGVFASAEPNTAAIVKALGNVYRETRFMNPLFMRRLPVKHLVNATTPALENYIVHERARKGLSPLPNADYCARFIAAGVFTVYEAWYESDTSVSFEAITSSTALLLTRGVIALLNDEI